MAEPPSVTPYFRVIQFGFPNRSALTEQETELLFESVITSRQFICASHDPALTPELRSAYNHLHYHILTPWLDSEDIIEDAAWSKFFNKIHDMEGWLYIRAGCDIDDSLAIFKMPDKKLLVNTLKGILLKVWNTLHQSYIDYQISKHKKV